MKIILLAKKDKPYIQEVVSYLTKHFDVEVHRGRAGDKFPRLGERDILISYLSPWVIPQKELDKTKKWNINFHPGSSDYPGFGCYDFAILDKSKKYGATAHIMEKKVDSGKIIGTSEFTMSESITVPGLMVKTYDIMYKLFLKVMGHIINYGKLPDCSRGWSREPYTMEDFDKEFGL